MKDGRNMSIVAAWKPCPLFEAADNSASALPAFGLLGPASRTAWFLYVLGGLAVLIFGMAVFGFILSTGRLSQFAVLALWLAPFAKASSFVFGRLVRTAEPKPFDVWTTRSVDNG